MALLEKYRLEIKYILLGICLLAGFKLLNTPEETMESVVRDLAGLGLVGFFVINFTGNSLVLINMPYNVITLTFALNSHSLWYMIAAGVVVGIAAGLGRAVAYMVIYNLSDYSGLVSEGSLFDRVRRIIDRYPRTIPLLVYLSAALPFPNDTTTLPLAMVKYPVKKYAPPKLAGKVTHNVCLAVLMHFTASALNLDASNAITTDISLIVLLGVVLYLLYRWEKHRLEARLHPPEPVPGVQPDLSPGLDQST